MPELPEVEILVRHLRQALARKTIQTIEVRRLRTIQPTSLEVFHSTLMGAKFMKVERRAKFLVFTVRPAHGGKPFILLGHLGMTGRIYLADIKAPLPKHAAVVFHFGQHCFVFEDTRYFGRLTLDTTPLSRLGPEPFSPAFSADSLAARLKRSCQAIKVRLLDQSLVAGVGNIYASEALFSARISPRLAARRLTRLQCESLVREVRKVLSTAIGLGSTLPLDFAGVQGADGLFYYGNTEKTATTWQERFQVYDRTGQPCRVCRTPIRRIVQAGRSTFFCPSCQR